MVCDCGCQRDKIIYNTGGADKTTYRVAHTDTLSWKKPCEKCKEWLNQMAEQMANPSVDAPSLPQKGAVAEGE